MSRLAFMTFAILREPSGHPVVQGFFDVGGDVFATADAAEGFIDRCRYDGEAGNDPYGQFVTGRFVTPEFSGRVAQTLSLWTGPEAVFAYAYAGIHADALRRRREWFVKPAWPTYVAWWVADDRWPDWCDAHVRLEHLYDHGSTPFAFDFRTPFGVDGQPVILDRARVATDQAH